MKNLKIILRTASLVVLSATLFSGCVAAVVGAAAGAGSYAYVNGELKSSEPVALETAFEAAKKAVADLGLTLETSTIGLAEAKVQAITGEDKRVWISLDKEGDKVTEIGVRVGLIGDKMYSATILDKIREYL